MTTTAEVAERVGTTPRQFRRFLRAEGEGVGQGKRYELPRGKRDLNSLTKRYNQWAADHTRNGTAK